MEWKSWIWCFFVWKNLELVCFFVSAENGAGVNKMSRMFFSWSVPGVSNHFKSKAESLSWILRALIGDRLDVWLLQLAHVQQAYNSSAPSVLACSAAGDMGPAPLLEPPDWDTHSVESRYTEESKVGFETQVTGLSQSKINTGPTHPPMHQHS